MLDAARRGTRVPVLARWLLGLGIAGAASAVAGLGGEDRSGGQLPCRLN
jgi:hypothetical protein